MSYIDLDYYKTTFVGNDPGDDTELTRYISRASDMIDLYTDFKAQDFDNLETYQQTAIKQATAYQTEYLVENGDVWTESGSATSEKVGSWSVNKAAGTSGKAQQFSPVAKSYLMQSDLMQNIIGITGECSETYIC